MRKELSCPRCGGAVFWHIRALEEHTGFGEQPLPVGLESARPMAWSDLFRRPAKDYLPRASGWFELLVCEGCNHVEWYARGFDEGRLDKRPFGCPACGCATAFAVRELEEHSMRDGNGVGALPVLVTRSGSDGFYSLAICCDCGYVAFTAHALLAVTQDRDGVTVEKSPCACGAGERLRIALAMEGVGDHYAQPLHLSRAGRWLHHDVGALSPVVCRSCGATDWWARELDKLREDPARGVARLDGNTRAASDGGPYR